jgi:Uma2 family endonuclease
MQAITERQRRLFTYRELLELDRAGMFDNQRVELLEGEIIVMPPPNPPHAITTGEVSDTLGHTFGREVKVWMQNPVRLSTDMEDKNLPVPDVMVVHPKVYRDHPMPEDVFLLIEVADSSVKEDKGRKLSLYALHGIKEYWVINLITKQIEVYTNPVGEDYLSKRSYGLTEAFALQAFPDVVQVWLPETIFEVLESQT